MSETLLSNSVFGKKKHGKMAAFGDVKENVTWQLGLSEDFVRAPYPTVY